ncbi:MAG: endonuclease III domain-containing protein [Deltaproteobacteria bacterium]|nr:endonuclease III domain-containing protein [Deltaproteobacteria bacterium]
MKGSAKGGLPKKLKGFYESMYRLLGPQGWWPGRTRFEVIVGAILTQNTAWTNVKKAINNLRREKLLTPERLRGVEAKKLAAHIRPAGYFNIKAKRLKNFTEYLFRNYNGSLDRFLSHKNNGIRAELLGVNGIGPETADSILLYAGGHPEFVVDAYTKRMLTRHHVVKEDAGYDDMKTLFMENLPRDAKLFNEFHALIVKTGKDYCRTKAPACEECPLQNYL